MRAYLISISVFFSTFSFGQTLTTDRSRVIRTGAKEIQLPGVPEHPFTSIDLPGGGTLTFSIPLTRQDVPAGWSTWHSGLTPKIFESPDGKSVTLTFSRPAAAFGVELMPVWKKGRNMRLEIVGAKGEVLTQFVKIDPGARFFGFVGGKVKAVTLSKLPFDEGSFGIGRILFKPSK